MRRKRSRSANRWGFRDKLWSPSGAETPSMAVKKIGQIMCWLVAACGVIIASAGLLMLGISLLRRLRSGTWPDYDLRMLWDELHLKPWNVQETIDSVLALIPTLPVWAAAMIAGGGMYLVGRVGYALFSACIQLSKHPYREI